MQYHFLIPQCMLDGGKGFQTAGQTKNKMLLGQPTIMLEQDLQLFHNYENSRTRLQKQNPKCL